ncbi:30S ribosomal protein S8 [Candidatus Babeliales bacterium]|nr:30S ribosomal protein S8 [Candidatus Babeliales bacterium]
MSIDVLGNFLTSIRNALLVGKRRIVVFYSREKFGIAQVLKNEGFIREFEKIEDEDGKLCLVVHLKYVDGQPAINEIKRVSKPSRRCYEGIRSMTSVIGGLGVSILNTNKGIITDRQARQLSVGGEVICHVW